MIVTRHAARRFVERIDTSYTESEALRILIDLSRRARPIRERTLMGQEQWVVDDVVFICKRDQRVSGDGLVAVTVARFETIPIEIDVLEQLEHKSEHDTVKASQDIARLTERKAEVERLRTKLERMEAKLASLVVDLSYHDAELGKLVQIGSHNQPDRYRTLIETRPDKLRLVENVRVRLVATREKLAALLIQNDP